MGGIGTGDPHPRTRYDPNYPMTGIRDDPNYPMTGIRDEAWGSGIHIIDCLPLKTDAPAFLPCTSKTGYFSKQFETFGGINK